MTGVDSITRKVTRKDMGLLLLLVQENDSFVILFIVGLCSCRCVLLPMRLLSHFFEGNNIFWEFFGFPVDERFENLN